MQNVTCKSCGWVYMGVSRDYAEREVSRFNEYYRTLSPLEQRELYGGRPSSVKNYEHCTRCGSHYTNFRVSRADDCPNGCTTNPIIWDTV
jgi:hypothetical protein